jgi:hypothetical protein
MEVAVGVAHLDLGLRNLQTSELAEAAGGTFLLLHP